MAALISLLTLVTLSLLINRVATVALIFTGLSRESASFQARSALTGVGFTTTEAEQVVKHPVRRRIIMLLMLAGNVGIVTTMSTLLLTFINTVGPSEWLSRLVLLVIGLLVLWALANSQWIDRYLSKCIRWALKHWTHLDVRDYTRLLHLSGNYTITELRVQPTDWLANQRLMNLALNLEGVIVLGIQRSNGRYVGAPTGETLIRPGDTLILYGRLPSVIELDQRRADTAGEQAHQRAILKHERLLRKQDRQEQDIEKS